jgi:hypothetical protein
MFLYMGLCGGKELYMGFCMNGKDWKWPPARSEDLVSIQSKLPNVNIEAVDKAVWKTSKKMVL